MEKTFVFDYAEISDNDSSFSCALGPRLLLHGKLKVLSEGLYYESYFNKKNIFFGKTHLFIPVKDILEIDEKNTLVVFPDAVEVRTPRGEIFFHALAQRKAIYTALI